MLPCRDLAFRAEALPRPQMTNAAGRLQEPSGNTRPMAFTITITAEAEAQFRRLAIREQRILEAAIQAHLTQ